MARAPGSARSSRRPARRPGAQSDERLAALGAPEHDGQVAAGPVQVRLDDLEREPGRDRGVEGVPAALEHRHAGGRREPVRRGDHPEGAAQLGARREGHGPPLPPAPGLGERGASGRGEVARDEVALAGDVDERRLLLVERGADSCSSGQRVRKRQPEGGASGLGMSPSSTTRRAGPLHLRVGHDGRREERLRVRVLRPREQLVARSHLDDLAEVHHRDAVAEELHGREVVADEQAREAELALQVAEEVEDGRLHGDVERRDRLVRDQQARRDAERAGQADALALAARELVRVAVAQLGAQADRVEELDDPLVERRAAREPVQAERLADDLAAASSAG